MHTNVSQIVAQLASHRTLRRMRRLSRGLLRFGDWGVRQSNRVLFSDQRFHKCPVAKIFEAFVVKEWRLVPSKTYKNSSQKLAKYTAHNKA